MRTSTHYSLVFAVIFLLAISLANTFFQTKKDPRKQLHSLISQHLSKLSDAELTQLISEQIPSEERSPGVITGTLFFEKNPIFVKKISLTNTELQPQNKFSTANLFNLPLHYYRPGFTGFGAWRELYSNQKATEWVLTGEQKRFPLLYHFRILKKIPPQHAAADFLRYEDEDWEILNFINEYKNASFDLVLFFEYIPETLTEWLGKKLASQSTKKIDAAMATIKCEFEKLSTFLRNKKLIHIDPHFENILVKNNTFFLADFGLATMDEFALDSLEKYYCKSCLEFTKNALNAYLFDALQDQYTFDPETLTTTQKSGTQTPNSIASFFLKNYKSAYIFFAELSKKSQNYKSLFPTDELFATLVKNYSN